MQSVRITRARRSTIAASTGRLGTRLIADSMHPAAADEDAGPGAHICSAGCEKTESVKEPSRALASSIAAFCNPEIVELVIPALCALPLTRVRAETHDCLRGVKLANGGRKGGAARRAALGVADAVVRSAAGELLQGGSARVTGTYVSTQSATAADCCDAMWKYLSPEEEMYLTPSRSGVTLILLPI